MKMRLKTLNHRSETQFSTNEFVWNGALGLEVSNFMEKSINILLAIALKFST